MLSKLFPTTVATIAVAISFALVNSTNKPRHVASLNSVTLSKMKSFLKRTPSSVSIPLSDGYDEDIKIPFLSSFSSTSNPEHEFTPLHAALENGDERAARQLIRSGVNVNAVYISCKDPRAWSIPLHLAAQGNLRKSVKRLIKYGADVTIRDGKLNTALHIAAENGFEAVAALLISNKIPIDDRNVFGETALIIAAKQEHANVAKILLKWKANPNVVANDGNNVLHYASAYPSNGIFDALLAKRLPTATINARNAEGLTPLLIAISALDPFPGSVVKALDLILAGADVTVTDIRGNGVLHHAATVKNKYAVELLLSTGIYVDQSNDEGNTPLNLALGDGTIGAIGAFIEGGARIPVGREDEILRKFLPYSHAAAVDATRTFDEIIPVVTAIYVQSRFGKSKSLPDKLKKLLKIYESKEVFALYRVLKAVPRKRSVNAGNSWLEYSKNWLLRDILARATRGTYLSTLNQECLLDALSSHVCRWKFERFAWHLALASHVTLVRSKKMSRRIDKYLAKYDRKGSFAFYSKHLRKFRQDPKHLFFAPAEVDVK